MKKILSSILAIIMVFCSVFSLAACKSGEEPSNLYKAAELLTWNKEGKYAGELTLSKENSGEFKDFSSEDFVLSAYNNETGEKTTINDFKVAKKDATTLTYEFNSKTDVKETTVYELESSKEVTTDKAKVLVQITTSAKKPELTYKAEGAHYGSDTIKVNLTISDAARFVDNINESMFKVEDEYKATIDAKKVSDSELLLTISNLPKYINYNQIQLTVLASAYVADLVEDQTIDIDYIRPEVKLDKTSVKYNAADNTLSIGKILLPENTSGIENGLSAEEPEINIISQKYVADGNFYSAVLKYTKKLDTAPISVKLVADKQEITCRLYVNEAQASILCDVENNDKDNLLTFTLVLNNASFKDKLVESDIKVSGNEDLKDFKFVSAAEDKAVFTAKYESNKEYNMLLSFEVTKDKIETAFPADDYVVSKNLALLSPNRVGVDIPGSLLTGAFGLVGQEAAKPVLSMLYDFLEIDTSDPEINKVSEKISNVSRQITDISYDISSLSNLIKDNFLGLKLDSYDNLLNEISVYGFSIIGTDEVIDYNNIIKRMKDGRDDVFNAVVLKAVGNPLTYTAKVKSLGDGLIQTGAGTGEGYIRSFFQVIDSKFNFESQTTEYKKEFLARAECIYNINAAIALQYLNNTNDANAKSLETQMNRVNAAIEGFKNELNAAEDRAKAGKDRLLVIGQNAIIKKNMLNNDIDYFHMGSTLNNSKPGLHYIIGGWPIGKNTYEMSPKNIEEMINRAKARGRSLAEDLKAAGFTDVNPNTDGQYIYLNKESYSTTKHVSTAKAVFEFLGKIAVATKDSERVNRGDLVFQKDREAAVIKYNTEICRNEWYQSVRKTEIKFSKSYDKILSFEKA